MELLWFLIIGLIAGWLASTLMRGNDMGVIGNIIVGIIGAIIGGYVFGLLGISAGGTIGAIISAFVGAVILLFIIGMFRRSPRV